MNQSITANRDSDHPVDKSGEHHAGHDSRLQHHFATFEQQLDAGKIGMWLFLATEILLFGGLFVGFALQQAAHPLAFIEHQPVLRNEQRGGPQPVIPLLVVLGPEIDNKLSAVLCS